MCYSTPAISSISCSSGSLEIVTELELGPTDNICIPLPHNKSEIKSASQSKEEKSDKKLQSALEQTENEKGACTSNEIVDGSVEAEV